MTKVKPNSANTEKKERKPLPHAFKPGVSGNPAGRPPGSKNLTTMVREALQKIASGEGMTAQTYYDLLVKRILKSAIEGGDSTMLRELWRQHDGAPAQKVELSGGVATGKVFAREQMARIAKEVLDAEKKKDQ